MTESIEDQLQRHRTSLTIALRVHDDLAAMIAAARLRHTVEVASATVPATAIQVARALLASAPTCTAGDHRPRLARWVDRLARVPDRPEGPDLFELDAGSHGLDRARLAGLHVASSVFRAGSLVEASFEAARLEGCDLSGANLERTLWCGARVIECTLAGSNLVDASLEEATFIDCDLRGADLGAVRRRGYVLTMGTVLVRCDLSETSWDPTSLARVHLIDCKLYGTRGRQPPRSPEPPPPREPAR